MYLIGFPLLLIPFALYNIVAFLLSMSLDDKALSIPLLDERSMTVSVGDAIVVIAMLLLYIEVLKATRLGKTVIDHLLSFVLLAAMASQLVLIPRAMTPTLMLLTVLGFVDLIRSEEHTYELQSLRHLVCRLLLEKKKKTTNEERMRESGCARQKSGRRTTDAPPRPSSTSPQDRSPGQSKRRTRCAPDCTSARS